MKQFFTFTTIVLAVALTIFSGVLYGRLSNSWGPSDRLVGVAQQLESLPADCGDWKLRESEDMSEGVVDMLQCAGYLNRKYVNEQTGEIVSVAVLLGPHGPISVHTPAICYSSRNYKLIKKDEVTTIKTARGEQTFWRTEFESKDIDNRPLHVYHGWTFDGQWQADKQPRFAYIGKPYLFKIQLATSLPVGAESGDTDACTRFLEVFIPALDEHMFRQ